MTQAIARYSEIKKPLLFCFLILACNSSKTDQMKVNEMNADFDKSMRRDTYFSYDTIRNPKNGEPVLFLEYIYDSINGVKSIHQKSTSDGLNFYQQANFLKGAIYKLKVEVLPDSVEPGTKYKPDTYMYYVIKDRLIPKIETDSDYRYLIPTLIHSYDSAANKFEERLKLR
jgi:hypothetical protein